MVIHWLRLCDDDFETLSERYGSILEREDTAAAKWFYENNREAIDRRLEEEAEYT